jgi:hypothetical protein
LSAFCVNGLGEVATSIGAVGEDIAWLRGQGIRPGSAIIPVGRCDGDFLDQCRVGVGADMSLEA